MKFGKMSFISKVYYKKFERFRNRRNSRPPFNIINARENIFSLELPPRIVWMYWDQGWDNAPGLAKFSLIKWATLNPDWTVIALDRSSAKALTAIPDEIDRRDMKLAFRADLVRLDLLARHGGVWADATTIPLLPLAQWLPTSMLGGFFAFSNPGPDRLVANWFLAANRDNALVTAWRDLLFEHWRRFRQAYAYHCCHYLFDYAVRANAKCRRSYALMSKVTDKHVSAVQTMPFDKDLADQFAEKIACGMIPMQKLSFNIDLPEKFENTPLSTVLGVSSRSGIDAFVAANSGYVLSAVQAANEWGGAGVPARMVSTP